MHLNICVMKTVCSIWSSRYYAYKAKIPDGKTLLRHVDLSWIVIYSFRRHTSSHRTSCYKPSIILPDPSKLPAAETTHKEPIEVHCLELNHPPAGVLKATLFGCWGEVSGLPDSGFPVLGLSALLLIQIAPPGPGWLSDLPHSQHDRAVLYTEYYVYAYCC